MDPIEPLAESAPIAWAEAPRRCYHDPQTGDTCLWYHRVWQYLRLLGVISSVRTNTNFLTRTFRDRARTGRHPRVLVSATADYSMLAHLKSAYDQEGAALEVTVVDRCETSLMLNRWYADRYHVALGTASGDVLDYAPERPIDLICTHNFLGRFDTASRGRLIAHWHALLRPAGLVVTTQRIRPDTRHARSHYTAEEARALSEQVTASARAFRPRLDIDPDELGRAVYEYAIRKGAHVIRTTEEITDLFEAAGFEVELADQGEGAEERERDRPSSSAGKDTYRMRIVARKL
jgi:hypothetical protein